MAAPQVRCREIATADIDAVADLLTRGFAGRSRNFWMQGLRRQSERMIPQNCPRYGYLLESNGIPVGVLLLLYSLKTEAGEPAIRCNVSSWYVEPEFRYYATMLTSMAQKNKHVTYVNISPAVPTWPIIEAQGFRRYCDGFFYALPLLSRRRHGMRIERIEPGSRAIANLPAADFELLESHARYGCLALVCHTEDGPLPFIFLPKRARSGRFPLPAMQLVYCRDTAALARCAGALGRFLLLRGKPIVIVDANGPVQGLAGRYSAARGRKYFKGPHPPRLGDLSYTELVLYGP